MPVIDVSEIVSAAPVKRVAYGGNGRIVDPSEIVSIPDTISSHSPRMLPSHTPGKVKFAQISSNPYENEDPTFSNDVGGAVKSLADTGAVIGSAVVSPVVASIAGYAGMLKDGNTDLNSRAETIRKTQEALTYKPKTEEGANIQSAIAAPFEKLAEGGAYLGGKTADATGSPLAGTAVDTAVNMIPFAIPFLKKGYLAGKAAIVDSEFYRNATIPERNLVIQTIDETAAALKAQGWNDGQVDAKLARLDPAYFQEQLAKRVSKPVESQPLETKPVDVNKTPATETQAPTVQPEPLTKPVNTLPEFQPYQGGKIIPETFIQDIPPQSEGISNVSDNKTALSQVPAIRQDLPVSRNLSVLPEQPSILKPEENGISTGTVTPNAQISPTSDLNIEPMQSPSPSLDIQAEPVNLQPDVTEQSNTFERLSPAGKRGSAQSYSVNMSPSQRQSLAEIRQEVSDGEAGKRTASNMGQMDTGESVNVSWGSTFPDYFQNKGLTKKQVLPVIDRIIKGEPVTEAQWLMAEDLLKAKRHDTLNRVFAERAVRRSESESISNMTDAEKEAAFKAADDFFAQFGGEDEITSKATGTVGEHDTSTAGGSSEAPVNQTPTGTRTEKIDESGWGQQVAPELQGDKKPVQFGDKKPTGRNVGLSEFMDGFDDPQKDLFSKSFSGSHADTGGYNLNPPGAQNAPFGQQKVSALQLPEIVEIAKSLMNGQMPHIMRKLNKRGALGVFKTGKGSIELLADIAKTPGLLERVLAHEVGHLVDWLPDQDIKRGNILGRIASLKKYMGTLLEEFENAPGVLNKKDRARLRREAEKELKANERPEETVIETITREVPEWKYTGITPEMVKDLLGMDGTKYPKLYRAFQEMNTSEKKAVLVAAMKGLVHDSVSHFGERVQTGSTTVTEQVSRVIPGIHATPEAISKRYAELVEEEINKRNLYKREVISDELKNLTMHWKPFQPGQDPGYTSYRFSSVELYADAFSALINDPALVRQIAPTFEKTFMSYLHRKPEVSEIYYGLQQRLGNPVEVQQQRVENIYDMFDRGNEARNELAKKKPAGEGIKDSLARGLIDERHDILKVIREFEGQQTATGRKAREARIALEELPYISSEGNQAMYELKRDVMTPAEAADISKKDMGAFMFARRIIGEEFKTVVNEDGTTEQVRNSKASALGHTAETSKDLLKELKSQWGAEKYNEVERLVGAYRDWYMNVVEKARTEKLFTPELFDVIDENIDYSTNSVIDYLEKTVGRGGTDPAQVFKRVGSFQDIENPLIATTQKALSIIRAVAMNKAKRKTVEVLKEIGAAVPAEMTYSQDAGRRVPVDPKDPEQALMIFMQDGKPQYYYVDKHIANSFKNDSVRAVALSRFMSAISSPFRHLFVSKNPRWMVRNVVRDFKTTIKNNPDVGITNIPALAMEYKRAWAEVWKEVHNKGRSAVISDLMENKAIPDHRSWEAKDMTFDDELDRLEASFSLDDVADRQSNKATRALRRGWDWLEDTGRASDLWGKVAYAKYDMKNNPSGSSESRYQTIRNRVGTPNIKRRGAWNTITNNLFMFSNVGKEGIRGAYESYRKNPGAYIWKTFVMNILPSLLKWGARAGVAGVAVKKIMDGIPDNDMKSASIVPLFVDDNGKSHYLAIPQDYEGQYIGQGIDALIQLQFGGKNGLLNVMDQAQPYKSIHPFAGIIFDLSQYYMLDSNPVDSFRGKTVLTADQAKAGGKFAAEGMAKNTWNSAGLSTFYRFSSDAPEADSSAFEKALKTLPMNTLGAYYKVSDRGLTDNIDKAIKPVQQQEARERLIVRDVIKRMVESKDPVNPTPEELEAMGQHLDMIKAGMKSGTMRKENMHFLEAMLRAGSQRQKAAIVKSQEK